MKSWYAHKMGGCLRRELASLDKGPWSGSFFTIQDCRLLITGCLNTGPLELQWWNFHLPLIERALVSLAFQLSELTNRFGSADPRLLSGRASKENKSETNLRINIPSISSGRQQCD